MMNDLPLPGTCTYFDQHRDIEYKNVKATADSETRII